MPELPEVETVVRTLAPRVAGRRIVSVRILHRRIVRGSPPGIEEAVAGRAICSVRRQGKFILMGCEGGVTLLIHLGMTGQLLAGPGEGPHTRAVIELDQGQLRFDDIRMFGRLEVVQGDSPAVSRLGPDALQLPLAEFRAMLAKRQGRLKAVLLNQAVLSGLGNIYVDEALFHAGIHPLTRASRLSAARQAKLHLAVRSVLEAAIAGGGSSVSDYVDAVGRRGAFQEAHQVYRKTGKPCPRCGTPIRRILVAQRSTHFCPRCQR